MARRHIIDRAAMPEPFPDSVCHGCRALRRVETRRGSVFLRCLDPELPKYPPQPVLACPRRRANEG